MARSPEFTRTTRARETGDVLLELVTLEHADFASTIRRVDNTADFESRGYTWRGRPMSVSLPRDAGGSAQLGRIVFDDTDLEVVEALRSISTPPGVLVEVVRAENPALVQVGYSHLEVTAMRADDGQVSVTLGLPDYRDEPFPAHNFGPEYFSDLS